MPDFGYSERARELNEAHAEMRAAFKRTAERNGKGERQARRRLAAIAAFEAAYARVYSMPLRLVDQGTKRPSELNAADILDFLEADPFFDRSGYMKERLLAELKRRNLTPADAKRLQGIILSVVQKPDRREFRRYCRVAITVDDPPFREQLEALAMGEDGDQRRRSRWVLSALHRAKGTATNDR